MDRQKACSCCGPAFSPEQTRGNWRWDDIVFDFSVTFRGSYRVSHPFKSSDISQEQTDRQKGCFRVCFLLVTTLKSEESISWKKVAFKSSNQPNPTISPSSFYKMLNNSLSTGGRGPPTSCSGKYQSSVVTNVAWVQCLRAHVLSELRVGPKASFY